MTDPVEVLTIDSPEVRAAIARGDRAQIDAWKAEGRYRSHPDNPYRRESPTGVTVPDQPAAPAAKGAAAGLSTEQLVSELAARGIVTAPKVEAAVDSSKLQGPVRADSDEMVGDHPASWYIAGPSDPRYQEAIRNGRHYEIAGWAKEGRYVPSKAAVEGMVRNAALHGTPPPRLMYRKEAGDA